MESISRISSLLESGKQKRRKEQGGRSTPYTKENQNADATFVPFLCLARELTLDAASAAASRGSRTPTRPPDKAQIKRLLDSRNEREVLDGLRKVIAVRAPAQDE